MLDPAWTDVSVTSLLDRSSRGGGLITAFHGESVGSVIKKMREHAVSQVPVLGDSKELLGMVREVALLDYMLQGGGHDAAEVSLDDAEVIAHDVMTIAPDTPLETLTQIFNTHSVVIVKTDTELVNIITKIDLIDFLANA